MAVDRFPVEEGSILMFARAVGDPNPIYSDPTYAAGTELGSVIAPPTYVQASAQFEPEYPLRPKLGEPWFGSGKQPTGVAGEGPAAAGRRLHAEQEFTYHRHLRPGDILSTTSRPGKTWEKQGRSGTLVFSEFVTEYHDQGGQLVVTARNVSVVTEGPAGGKQ